MFVGHPVPVKRRSGVSAMRYVDPIDVFVILDQGFHAGLPKHVVSSGGPHPYQLLVLEFGEKPRSLAEISPDGVMDYFCLG